MIVREADICEIRRKRGIEGEICVLFDRAEIESRKAELEPGKAELEPRLGKCVALAFS